MLFRSVVASGDITAGNALIDATTANAFAAPVGVDLSAYQTGKYRLDLYSTATGVLWAQGFISATAPSGLEESTTDVYSGYNLTSGWTTITATINSVNKFTNTSTDAFVYKNMAVAGGLYKTTLTATVTSGVLRVLANGGSLIMAIAGAGSKYATNRIDVVSRMYFKNIGGGNGAETVIDSISMFRVSMPAATGVLLLSSYGGSRGFVFQHASFDPNAALSYKIVKVID